MNVIVEREKGLLELEKRIAELRTLNANQPVDLSAEIAALQGKYAQIQREVFGAMSPWQRVNMARHPSRPVAGDYLAALDRFDELHGDRHYRDDPAVIGGFAKLDGRRIMAVGQQRGRDTKENLRRNFGMVTPEGYRKVKRLVLLAVRLGLPVVTFVDTKGADPGIGSEERAQSEAIASCLYAFCSARVPIVATIVGEGGSGGALALAIADRVIMLEHSVYSVASPEGCAAILWGDAGKAEEAASRLKLTSEDLHAFGIIDEIVPEPLGGAHRDAAGLIAATLQRVAVALDGLRALTSSRLLEERYRKYRRIGAWQGRNRETLSAVR
ncbi:MAG: acetyl-CoA carboxylase carboxyl transferase subunit alpha [Candidatus Meridianibacter frigidus]|nr:MAG: acetyl-CoA carboxylase carboxyl transferase subunit alpha [Candidatus Eremiobacteraeota bacterium]